MQYRFDEDFEFPVKLVILFSILLLEFVSIYYFLRCTLIDPGIVMIPFENTDQTGLNFLQHFIILS